MRSIPAFVLASLLEIGGCYAFWGWFRLGRPTWWLVPGVVFLAVFATLLTQVESAAAGRAYAAYGGIYIAASLLWLWWVENIRPDRWDAIGAVICLFGMAVILFGPRSSELI